MYVITNVFSDILIWICICKWHRGSYLLAGQPYSFASSIALQNWSIGLFKLILSSFAFAKSAFGHGVLRNVLWKEVRRVLSDVRLMLLVLPLPCHVFCSSIAWFYGDFCLSLSLYHLFATVMFHLWCDQTLSDNTIRGFLWASSLCLSLWMFVWLHLSV